MEEFGFAFVVTKIVCWLHFKKKKKKKAHAQSNEIGESYYEKIKNICCTVATVVDYNEKKALLDVYAVIFPGIAHLVDW